MSFRNHTVTQAALLLLLTLFQSTLSLISCPDQCECVLGEEAQYFCKVGDKDILFFIGSSRRGQYLRVECNGNAYKSEELPQTDLRISGPAMLEINNCSLPDEPIAKTLQKITPAATFVNFTIYEVKNLSSQLFQNLSDQIIRLTFVGSITEIPDFVKELRNLKSLEVSKSALIFDLSNVPDSLEYLNFMRTSFKQINPGTFKHLINLKQLQLNRNDLTEINEGTFEGLVNLKILSLMGNRIKEIRKNTFNNLKSLEQLDLTENPIELIESFGELPNLYYFKANNNHGKNGTIIANRTFANLPALREVNLKYFNIHEVASDAFEKSSELKKLDLSHNSLINISVVMLRDQKTLEYLDLGYNNIKELSQDSFKNLQRLQKLILDKNELKMLPGLLFSNLRSLQKLSIRENNITHIDYEAFPNSLPLTDLDLSRNQLNFLTTFGLISPLNRLLNLKRLNLANNNISYISEDWLFNFQQLESLDLRNNSLAQLQTQDFANILHEMTIDLRHNNITSIWLDPNTSEQNAPATIILQNNPLNCDCNIYNFIENLKTYPRIKVEGATCSTPQSLHSVPVLEASPSALYCEDHCPQNCNCKVLPASDTNFMNCQRVPEFIPEQLVSHVSLRLTHPSELPNYLPPIISALNLSSLDLMSVPKLPANHSLEILDLSLNKLTYVPELLLRQKFSVLISNNPLKCDCWHASSLSNLDRYRFKIRDFNVTRCGDTKELVSLMTYGQLCAPWFIWIGVVLACIGAMAAVVVALFYRNEMEIKAWLYHKGWLLWWICEEDLDKDKTWDVFISYAYKDEQFVVSDLEPRLVEPPHCYKVCLHFREWGPGFITDHIVDTVSKSRRVIIVLSRAFLESTWGAAEFRAAHQQTIQDKRLRLMIILLEDISDVKSIDPELKAYLKTNTYIKWGSESAWKQLMYALPHSNLRKRTKNQNKFFGNLKIDTTLTGLKKEDDVDKHINVVDKHINVADDKGKTNPVLNEEMVHKINSLGKSLDLDKELVININDLQANSSESSLEARLRPDGKMLQEDLDKFDAKKV